MLYPFSSANNEHEKQIRVCESNTKYYWRSILSMCIDVHGESMGITW